MDVDREAPDYRDLSDWVVLRILDAIRRGDIAPSERLVEHKIGARFSVSRAPVRDAFHKLETLGVVERVFPRGVIVRAWTDQDAAEVNLILDAAILVSVQLASSRLTDHDIAALDGTLVEARAMVEARNVDVAAQLELDARFHRIIATASGARRLCELIDSLMLPLQLYASESYSLMEPADWVKGHAELLEYLRRRDREGAMSAVLRNARASEAAFALALSMGSSRDAGARPSSEPMEAQPGPASPLVGVGAAVGKGPLSDTRKVRGEPE